MSLTSPSDSTKCGFKKAIFILCGIRTPKLSGKTCFIFQMALVSEKYTPVFAAGTAVHSCQTILFICICGVTGLGG